MLTLPALAGAWLLALQNIGPSSSVTFFPRNFDTEAQCTSAGEALKKQFYVHYVCIPPQFTNADR